MRDKSMNMNDDISRKASDSEYDKHRYSPEVSMISTYFMTTERVSMRHIESEIRKKP